jgi:sugar phosphate isomerase/epimerase
MRFAFSTLACPKWSFETIVSRAKEYGYDGVEVRGFLNESILTAANVFLSDPIKVRDQFARAGVEIACLASSITLSGSKRIQRQLAGDVRQFVDTAKSIGSSYVRIFDTQVRPGQSRAEAAAALAEWLTPLGDYAADRNVTILIENALSFRQSKEMWLILEMFNHPAVAVCWDVFNAAIVGEPPAVSVPTLNNRIQYTQVKDALIGPLGATFTKLGAGNVRVQDFTKRLMGIGYTGWVTFEWEKAWLPNLAEPEDVLPDAVKKLREWTKPQLEDAGAASDAEPASAH